MVAAPSFVSHGQRHHVGASESVEVRRIRLGRRRAAPEVPRRRWSVFRPRSVLPAELKSTDSGTSPPVGSAEATPRPAVARRRRTARSRSGSWRSSRRCARSIRDQRLPPEAASWIRSPVRLLENTKPCGSMMAPPPRSASPSSLLRASICSRLNRRDVGLLILPHDQRTGSRPTRPRAILVVPSGRQVDVRMPRAVRVDQPGEQVGLDAEVSSCDCPMRATLPLEARPRVKIHSRRRWKTVRG